MRTLKEELVWINEWPSSAAFFEARGYNTVYLHSALGYRTPEAVERELTNPRTPLELAC